MRFYAWLQYYFYMKMIMYLIFCLIFESDQFLLTNSLKTLLSFSYEFNQKFQNKINWNKFVSLKLFNFISFDTPKVTN